MGKAERRCPVCGVTHFSVRWRCGPCERDHRKHPCAECGKPVNPQSERCKSCARIGELSPLWRGGRRLRARGYWAVKVSPDDPYAVMASADGYVLEHRLVMARHVGRPLASAEHVHHINHDPADNRIENLEILNPSDHSALHADEVRIGPVEMVCDFCGATFLRRWRQYRGWRNANSKRAFCSVACAHDGLRNPPPP